MRIICVHFVRVHANPWSIHIPTPSIGASAAFLRTNITYFYAFFIWSFGLCAIRLTKRRCEICDSSEELEPENRTTISQINGWRQQKKCAHTASLLTVDSTTICAMGCGFGVLCVRTIVCASINDSFRLNFYLLSSAIKVGTVCCECRQVYHRYLQTSPLIYVFVCMPSSCIRLTTQATRESKNQYGVKRIHILSRERTHTRRIETETK